MAKVTKRISKTSGRPYWRLDYRDAHGKRCKERYPTERTAKRRLAEVERIKGKVQLKKRRSLREVSVEAYLVDEMTKLGWRSIKGDHAHAGFPDRIFFGPGARVELVELKTERGQLSAAQRDTQGDLVLLGFNVKVLRGLDDAVSFLEEVRGGSAQRASVTQLDEYRAAKQTEVGSGD